MMATEAAVDKAADATASQSQPVRFILSVMFMTVCNGRSLTSNFGSLSFVWAESSSYQSYGTLLTYFLMNLGARRS